MAREEVRCAFLDLSAGLTICEGDISSLFRILFSTKFCSGILPPLSGTLSGTYICTRCLSRDSFLDCVLQRDLIRLGSLSINCCRSLMLGQGLRFGGLGYPWTGLLGPPELIIMENGGPAGFAVRATTDSDHWGFRRYHLRKMGRKLPNNKDKYLWARILCARASLARSLPRAYTQVIGYCGKICCIFPLGATLGRVHMTILYLGCILLGTA